MKTVFILFLTTVLAANVNGNCVINRDITEKASENFLLVKTEEPKTVKLKITGMTCAGCANHVSKALKNVNGVIEQSVEYPGDVAIVKYDAAKTKPEELIKAIEKAGYKAEVIKPNTKG